MHSTFHIFLYSTSAKLFIFQPIKYRNIYLIQDIIVFVSFTFFEIINFVHRLFSLKYSILVFPQILENLCALQNLLQDFYSMCVFFLIFLLFLFNHLSSYSFLSCHVSWHILFVFLCTFLTSYVIFCVSCYSFNLFMHPFYCIFSVDFASFWYFCLSIFPLMHYFLSLDSLCCVILCILF